LAGSLRDIRLFVAAYEERSFTAAAARERATQSGVSQHIRNLETALGVALFQRGGGPVTPTPAAESYYRHCLDVIRAHETATRAARAFGSGLDGEIVIGLMPTMTRCALAPALKAFVEAHPNVVVRVVEGYSAALTQSVRAGELDFAVVPATPGLPGLRSRLFARTPEVLVAGAQAWRDLPARGSIRLKDIAPLKLVSPGKANTRRATIETYCAVNAVAIARLIELDAMLGTLDFVARTDWVAILPGIMMAAGAQDGSLKVLTLAEPPLSLDLVLIEPARQPMSEAAAAFLAELESETLRLEASPDAAPSGPPKAPERRGRFPAAVADKRTGGETP